MRKHSLTFLFLLVACVCAGDDKLECDERIPMIADLLNRVSNTTLGLIGGSVNFIGRAVDRVINTFGRVEDRLRALLAKFRGIISRGIPDININIPVPDPLHFNKIDANHEAAQLKWKKVSNLTIKHIWKFHVDKKRFTALGHFRFKLDLNLTFPYVTVTGNYMVNGHLARILYIFGEGPFGLNYSGIKLGTSIIVKFRLPAKLRVESLIIDIKLEKLETNFENLLNNKEAGEIVNRVLSKIGPDLLNILWSEMRLSVQEEIKQECLSRRF